MSGMYASMLLASSSITAMAADFPDVSTVMLQQMVSINSFSAAFMCVITGFLVYRFRVKTLSLWSMGFMLVGGAGVAFVNDFTVILALRLIYGVGMGLNHSLMPTVISWYLRENKSGIATSIKQAGGQAATMIFTFLAGTLSVLNWRYPFLVYGFSIIVAIAVWICLPKKQDDIEIPRHEGKIKISLPGFAWGWIILIMFAQIGIYAFQTNLTQLVVIGMGYTTVEQGLCGSLVALGGVIGGSLLYKVHRTLDRWTIPIMLFLYGMTLFVCYFFSNATPIWALYLDCFIHGLVYFIYNGLIILQLGNAVKQHEKGLAVSLGMAAMQAGNFITPFVWVPLATAWFGRDWPQDRMLIANIALWSASLIFAIIAFKKARIAYAYHEDTAGHGGKPVNSANK